MNKNTLIGTVLMCLIFMAMVWTSQPSAEQLEAQRRAQDSIARLQTEAIENSMNAGKAASEEPQDSLALAQADSIKQALRQQKYGNIAAAATGEEQIVNLSNNVLSVDISTKGGVLQKATLLEYENYKDEQLVLFDAKNNHQYFTFYSVYGKYITTEDIYFTPLAKTDSSVVMRLKSDDGGILDFVYRLSPDSYLLDFTIHTVNLDNIVAPTQPSLQLTWNQKLVRTELGRSFEERYSSLFYKYSGESVNDLSQTGSDSERLDGPLAWFNFKNQFFSTILASNDLFRSGSLSSNALKEETSPEYLKEYSADLEIDFTDRLKGEQIVPMTYFIGPNNYSLLRDMNDEIASRVGKTNENLEIQNSIYLGWPIVRHINRWIVIPIFHFLDNFNLGYGLIILLLTIFIKLVTLPFTYKSFKSSAKMRIAQKMPEVQAINEKYPNQEDAMAKQQALMALYGKMGVNQMGGCLPMLLSWPVLIALFYFFPTSIELRGESFLWAKDLSTYDAIITWDEPIPVVNWIFHGHISLFCLIMTVVQIFYTWLMQKQNPAQQAMPGMAMMMYLMPLFFLVFLNDYSAGLSYYYTLSLLFSIIQTYAIRASMNEDKILAEMKANLSNPNRKKGGKKASGWIARLQEIQRQQQEELRKQREEQMRKQRR
ncbi:MAG: membrane protein insertase YidC [Bacteroidales bacterium]|nr:membrane protein insertase YidC [Bacteroidales bacterium]